MRTPDGSQARDKAVNLRVTPEMFHLITLAARASGASRSAWLRWIITKEIEAKFGVGKL